MTSPGEGHTFVDLTWRRGQAQAWIRFGQPVGEVLHDRRRRTLAFAPGAVFGLVRWASNDYGTVRSELDILKAVGAGEACVSCLFVRPGGELLVAARGWLRVQRLLAVIDALEAVGVAPALAAPDYWRHVHNRIAAGLPPRPYDPGRHRAWLLRRRVQS